MVRKAKRLIVGNQRFLSQRDGLARIALARCPRNLAEESLPFALR